MQKPVGHYIYPYDNCDTMINIIILVEIAARESKFVDWISSSSKLSNLNVKIFVIFKDDFYNNILYISKIFKDQKVILIDKSYQSYMRKKLAMAKSLGYGIILRDEEFLVRLSKNLSKDRYSHENAAMADIILVWGEEERNLILNDGIPSSKIKYGSGARYLNYDKCSVSEVNKYKLLIVSSFGDLFPKSGVRHKNKEYIDYLKSSIKSIAALIVFCVENKINIKYRFHPFEDVKLMLYEFRNLQLDILNLEYVKIEYPNEMPINQSLAEATYVVHIGSTVAYDYFYATQGRKAYMLDASDNPIHGPEKVSIKVTLHKLADILMSNKKQDKCIKMNNEMVKLPEKDDVLDFFEAVNQVDSRILNSFGIKINFYMSLRKYIRTGVLEIIFKKRYQSANFKRLVVNSTFKTMLINVEKNDRFQF